MKKNKIKYLIIAAIIITVYSCQKRDIQVSPAIIPTVTNLTYTLQGDSVLVTWALPTGTNAVHPTINDSTSLITLGVGATSYKYGIVQTNKPYVYTVKLLDTKGNSSLGQTVRFTRAGAAPVTNVSGVQVDNNVNLSWTTPSTSVTKITVKLGNQSIDLAPGATSYQFANVPIGSYIISIVTINSSNQVSNTVYLPFKVGATTVGYLGMYADSLTLLSTGSQDEVAGAKWLFSTYPSSRYISLNQIKTGAFDLAQFRVLWWNYDLASTTALPAIATDPAVVNNISNYYKNGGNLLLNQFAVQWYWTLGRITMNYFTQYDGGGGFYNPDAWGVGVNIDRKHNQSSHPIYNGITMTTQGDGRVTFPIIGPGWKMNHNAVIVRIPETYGLPNDSETAYNNFVADNNAVWLGMWDGIGDYFSAGIIELQPKGAFQGTGLFIGIGAIEFSQTGVVNPYQANVQKLYKNSIDYLKTK